MREIVIPTRSEDTSADERVTVSVFVPDEAEPIPDGLEAPGRVLTATHPKDAVVVRAMGIFGDKYAPDHVIAKTAFDFLETTLDHDSWAYVVGRLNDRDDDFDTDGIIAVFTGLFEEFKESMPEDDNRQARRAAKRTPARRR